MKQNYFVQSPIIGMMEQIGLHQIIDNHIPEHGNQRELSWGWTTVIWLAYIERVAELFLRYFYLP